MNELKERLRQYCNRMNLTEEDYRFLESLLEDAYNHGDTDGQQTSKESTVHAKTTHRAYGNDSFD